MPAFVGVISLMIAIFSVSEVCARESSIAAAVVEKLPSAEAVKLVVSPPKASYDYTRVCLDDSIRVRLQNIGLTSRRTRNLQLPPGSRFKTVKIVPTGRHRSVVQIFPRGSVATVCAQTSVMSMGGNLVVSMATGATGSDDVHTRGEKTDDADILDGASEKTVEIAADPHGADSAATNTRDADNEVGAVDTGSTSASNKTNKLAGTLFDKSEDGADEAAQETDNGTAMRYAGALAFAGVICLVAYFIKRKRGQLAEVEDNIDILSTRRLSGHQQLMVARVNGSRFLLAVGDKSVSSLGMIPTGSDDVDASAPDDSPLTEARRASDSRGHHGHVSRVPYSDIQDEPAPPSSSPSISSSASDTFGSDFMAAIDRITRQNEESAASADPSLYTPSSRTPSPRRRQEAAATGSDDVVPSNVAGLISMARMHSQARNAQVRNSRGDSPAMRV